MGQFYLRKYKLNQSYKVACEPETTKDMFYLVHSVILFCFVVVLLLVGIECFSGSYCNLPESSPLGLLYLISLPWRFYIGSIQPQELASQAKVTEHQPCARCSGWHWG